MLLHGGRRNFGKYECGATDLSGSGAAKRLPRKCPQTCLDAFRLIGDASLQRSRPVAVNKIVAAVEEEQSGIVQVPTRPGRHVKRRAEPSPASIAATNPS